MICLFSPKPEPAILARIVLAACVAACVFAYAQTYLPNQEVRIGDLPLLGARSKDASDVLAASVEIVFRDQQVCCDKKSALGDLVQSADPLSLKGIGDKLQGRHMLGDGRSIVVRAEYVPASSVNSARVIASLRDGHPPLMVWNSHIYVVYGAVFDETLDSPATGARMDAIRKFLLLDTRFSDGRREVFFNRLTDDWGKVQGLLMLSIAPT
jgi:hypothetical protein